MFRILAAAALGISIAAAPVAAPPAKAMTEEQLAQILAGLAIAGIVGAAVKKQRDDRDDDRRRARSKEKKKSHGYRDRGHQGHRARDHGRRLVPARCVRSVETRRGYRHVVGERCLSRSGIPARALPGRCETRVHVGGRWRDAYGARCLKQYGWRVARR